MTTMQLLNVQYNSNYYLNVGVYLVLLGKPVFSRYNNNNNNNNNNNDNNNGIRKVRILFN